MGKHGLHIHRLLSVLMLWVFAIALTPFGAFHHHHEEEVQCVSKEKSCTHKLHISSHTEHCLVCEAHFEKNYLIQQDHFQTYLVYKPVAKYYATVSGFYTELIGQALRGPPLA